MDKEFIITFLKLIIFFPFIIFSIVLVIKYGGGKLQNIQKSKFIKIYEKIPLSKDNSLFIVKIGEKGYVLSSTNSNIEIILELKEEELKKIESSKQMLEYINFKENIKIKDKLKGKFSKKED